MIKKIDSITLSAIVFIAIFIFSMPYIIDIVNHSTNHSTNHCSLNYQSIKCTPVIF